MRLVLATPALRPIALVAFSYGAVQLCLFAFLVTYLVERVALDLVTAGLLFSVMQGAGIVARVGWGWLNDRWLPARPLLAAIGVGIVASVAAAASFTSGWPLAGLAVVCAALGLTGVGWNGVYLAEVARATPIEKVGSATGGVMMFTFLGIVVGPSTFGAIVAASGSYPPRSSPPAPSCSRPSSCSSSPRNPPVSGGPEGQSNRTEVMMNPAMAI